MITNKRHLLVLGIMVTVFCLGWHAGISATNRKAYASLWEAIVNLPDPERCALCGEGIRYHAPCLINLSTGQIGEMQVYTEHRTYQGELAPKEQQQTGTLNFQPCAGLTAVRDTCSHTCEVFLPAERELMNPALFCRECRQLLAGAGLGGYVILDLYDQDNMQAYPLRGAIIRDYCISTDNRKDGSMKLCVTGLLEH